MTRHPHIIFAGAGPGDPGLVTMKLVTAMKAAECILVDRLVNPDILKMYSDEHAEILFVGKQGYEKESTTQSEINALLIEKATGGLRTLRLKGGDVAIYSNVLDEINALKSAGITYEIIPGVTAASGAAASLGIALTGRNIAQGIQIHTLSAFSDHSDATFKQWASAKDTLVFYMSISLLRTLVKRLIEFEADPDLPILIIEEATGPGQHNSVFTLGTFLQSGENISFTSPSIVLIGKMIDEITFEFLSRQGHANSIFKPVNAQTKNQTIHVI